MDHETRADSDFPSENAEPTQGEESSAGAEETTQPSDIAEAPGFEASTSDLGTESSLLSDSWSDRPAPPEWPAVDLGGSNDDEDTTAAEDAAVDAQALIDNMESPIVDPGDDSDAPVHLDDDGVMRGENVNLSQGGVKSIEATNVTFSQGGAGQVRAEQMSMEQGGVGLARVETLTLGNGASAFAVLADQANVEEGSNTFLVVTRSLSGDVRPTIDWRGALAFGAGLGLALSILRRIR